MSFSSLPPELVADILDTFVQTYPSHAQRVPNLASISLVDRTLNALAQPLLYRNVYLDSTRRTQLLNALENTTLASHVRTLTLSGGMLDAEEFVRMKQVLKGCTGVRSLTYLCFDHVMLPDLTDFIAETWPTTLRYLRADQKDGLYDLLSRLPELETLIASYIEFPAVVPTPSRSSTPPPTSAPGVPVRPTFRLKRLDSGSSPSSAHFHLLTSSSSTSLQTLDLPISSRSPSQDLSSFASLHSLTLTLCERYIPHDLDPRPHGAPSPGRDDAWCLRRVKRVLERAREADLPLRYLEIFEPSYAPTRAFDAHSFEDTDVLDAVPPSVRELDLATVDVAVEYVVRKLGPADENEQGPLCCAGLRRIVLKRQAGGAKEVKVALGKRGIEVRWA
ncbi:hypothetical protein JCM21900_000379 [Sporobolomyces salmonicolor]